MSTHRDSDESVKAITQSVLRVFSAGNVTAPDAMCALATSMGHILVYCIEHNAIEHVDVRAELERIMRIIENHVEHSAHRPASHDVVLN